MSAAFPADLSAALLAHQDFVRALARGLVAGDEVDDVVQETWLAALARPPRDAGALRGWLAAVVSNRARRRVRDASRRLDRERASARPEALDPAPAEERLALEHAVVGAVLALREPYRTTVLERWYEGLSTAEIARRRGLTEGTVRARCSRALAMLRERLDRSSGPRESWSAALGALAAIEPAASPAASALALSAAAAIAIAAAVVLVIASGVGARGAGEVELAALAPAAPEPSPAPPAGGVVVARAPLASEAAAAVLLEPGPAAPAAREPVAQKPKALLANGGFDGKPIEGEPIPGWRVEVGATNGAPEPQSSVELDAREKRAGRASLRLAGDDTTRAWRRVFQQVEARPGATYRLKLAARTKDVRQETVRGTQIRQFANCFVALLVYDGNGEVVAKAYANPALPTGSWSPQAIEVSAPATARRVEVSISLTMSGTLWVDEVELEAEGGSDPPRWELLVGEGFEAASALPPGWEEELGAKNHGGGERSRIEVDAQVGAPGSPRSLRFEGDQGTLSWYLAARAFPAAPGDAFRLRALVKAEGVAKQGVQFANLHASLAFLDDRGQAIGTARFAQPGQGTFDWKPVAIEASAPEGTARVRVGLFLSMSGRAWFDEIALERQAGGRPAYEGWLERETEHLLLRYPPDHPRARGIAEYGKRLDRAYEDIVRSLGVEYDERITVMLYRDAEQGQRLTGRELDFANPEGRTVHQRPNSTLGHEMVHCIALRLGAAQCGLFGEGIAVWLDGEGAKLRHQAAAELLAKGELPTLAALVDDFAAQAQGYPAAGSFCGWLIEAHGIGRFREVYATADPRAALRGALGKELEELDAAWRAYLTGR